MRSSPFARRGARRLVAGVLAASLLAGGASVAFAQAAPSAAQLALARDLVEANGEAHAFDGVIANIVEGAAASFLTTNPDLARPLREAAQTVLPEFVKRQDEIVQILSKAYASRFTDAQLKEALAFFRTPTGKKLVSDRTAIIQETVQSIQAWGGQLNAQAVERIRAEMKKKGYDI